MDVLNELSNVLVLAQAGSTGQQGGSPEQVWSPIIGFLQLLLSSAGALGIVIGASMIAAFAHDEGKRAMGWEVIGGSAMGLAIGLLAVPLYNLIDGWM